RRFPLLLKFLDAHEMLSVQVHPTKANRNLLPPGDTAKTEAWVVLEAATQSRIYAGLKPGTTTVDLRRALTNGTVADHLACLTPKPGDAVFLRAGTVHSLGGDVVVFEVQQNRTRRFACTTGTTWTRRRPNREHSRWIRRWHALILRKGQSVGWRQSWRKRRRWNARDSSTVNISGCGACAENLHLLSAPSMCRACWCAWRARGKSSTEAPRITSQKATSSSCLRWLGLVLFGRAVQ